MNSKKRKIGNESSIIIVILALLLIVVLAIVGVIVAKDNKGIATFDGGKVTKSEYKIYYQMFSSYLQMYGVSSSEIPEQILTKAAQDKMILTDAKAAGIKISDENKKEVDDIFKDEEYLKYFNQIGFDLDDLKQIYYNDYIIQQYIEQLAKDASAEDVQNYINSKYKEGEEIDMNEYDTSHILFSFTNDQGTALSDEEKAALKTKAEEVLARAKAGEDFAALASEFSDDTATATEGGKYVMYMDGNTVAAYSDAVKGMSEGEVYATLVESSYGYHIIKLNAKTENGRLNSETERSEYANTLFDDIDTKKNLKIDHDLLKEFVLEINPTAYDDATTNNGTDSTTTDGTDVTVDGTDSTDGNSNTVTVE